MKGFRCRATQAGCIDPGMPGVLKPSPIETKGSWGASPTWNPFLGHGVWSGYGLDFWA